MSLWNNQTPPILYPNAVATPAGWADPITGELLVTVTGLSTYKNETAGTQLVSARILGAKVQGSDPIVTKKVFAAGDIMVVEAIFLEAVTKSGGTPTMTITINGNARTFTQFTDTSDFLAHTKGKVTGFTISGGSSYVVGDALTFSGGGGSSAKAQVLTVDGGGAITSVKILDGGAGYTSAPTVGVTSGTGSSASLTAKIGTLANGSGTNRWLFGYTIVSTEVATSAQIVWPASVTGVFDTTDDALGSAAAGTAVIATGVTAVTVTGAGSGYTSAPDVTFTGGTPTAVATAVAVLDQGVHTVVITAGGSAYTSAPTVAFTGGGGSSATATAVLATSGAVKSVTVGGSGTGYTDADPLIFSGGAGTGAAGHINVSGGNITSVTITAGGSGYTSAPTAAPTTVGGSGNTLTSVVGKAVASVTVTGAGTGFTSAPTVGFSGGGGTAAAATATLSNLTTVASVTIISPGNGYGGTPTVGFQNGGGTGATATATTSGVVESVTITAGGSKYWSVPTIGFSGGSGTGAAGTAVMDRGMVTSITMTANGLGYVSAPAVAFTQPAQTATNPTFNGTPSSLGFTVDGVAPTITSAVISGFETGTTFNTNNEVTFTVVTSKPVYVVGAPYITIHINGSAQHAAYVQGSGTNTLIFQYEIAAGDSCTATQFTVTSPIVLNSGTIKDFPGNNLTLTYSTPTVTAVVVNTPILPMFTNAALTGGPTFTTSGTATLTLTANENATVTTSYGTPYIELFIGNATQHAAYASGSGTTSLVFTYTIQAGDSATIGTFSTGSTVVMNGGAIKDALANNFPGTIVPPTTSSVTVN